MLKRCDVEHCKSGLASAIQREKDAWILQTHRDRTWIESEYGDQEVRGVGTNQGLEHTGMVGNDVSINHCRGPVSPRSLLNMK